jgi:hypothetical protein
MPTMILPPIPADTFVEITPGLAEPKLSILMPLYEQAAFVREALDSVLTQRNIVAEILISDDASTDTTFSDACELLGERCSPDTTPHRIKVRRGTRRLWRDHLPLLVEAASCDIVMQAHGDDVSHPERASIVCSVLDSDPGITMVASEAQTIDTSGQPMDAAHPFDPCRVEVGRFTVATLIDGHRYMIGFSQAWKKSALQPFARLDTAYAPVAHDRTLALRAAMTGEVLLIRAPLVKRRDHPMSGSQLSIFEPETAGRFGSALIRLSYMRTMERDIRTAFEKGLIDTPQRDEMLELIAAFRLSDIDAMLDAHHRQCLSRRVPVWLDERNIIRKPAAKPGIQA